MKKHLLLGFCILSISLSAFAQNQQLHIGLETGIVKGFFEVPPPDLTSSFFGGEIRSSLGPRMGVNLRLHLKSQLSFKTGIYFTQKGAASVLQPSPFGSGGILVLPNESLKFSFVQLPVTMRFHPLKLEGFYLGMGPYLGILVSHPHKGFETRPSYTPRNTFDLGFAASIGKEIAIHKGNYLALEASFELGTKDMSRFSDYRISNGSMLPRAFNFGVAYFFLPQ